MLATRVRTRPGSDAQPTPAPAQGSQHEVWEVPSFRPDVAREVDLIEEVARVRGYDAIPTTLPAIRPSRDAAPRESLARRAREAAVGMGLSEAITYSFVSPRDLAAVGAPEAAVVLRNPMSEEQSVMRTSLLPGLLRALANARRHGERDARLFTVGPLFLEFGPQSFRTSASRSPRSSPETARPGSRDRRASTCGTRRGSPRG